METVGRLASRYGLSRSTLLYYDRIGLLSPSGRSAAGYRLYDPADVARLEKILMFRDVGLPLESIGALLDAGAGGPGSMTEALEQRLAGIQTEIAGLRKQQEVILQLLQRRSGEARAQALDKQAWVEILRATGLDDDDMWRWHAEFERQSPRAHQEFLESLGIEEDELGSIRERSRQLAGSLSRPDRA